nr:hypothetical protein [Streptomyces sp. Termitarium-T10T-6]
MTMRLVAATSGIALAVSGLAAGGAAAAPQGVSAQSCYGSAKTYSKPEGMAAHPNWTKGSYYKTTGNCNDINIRPNTNRYVSVCLLDSRGYVHCQGTWKLATAKQWNTIATNVATGTKFYFLFRSTAKSTGSYAA